MRSAVLDAAIRHRRSSLYDGLIGCWLLDEASGDALDASGHHLTLSQVGSPVAAAGQKLGPAARQFVAASTQYLNRADEALLSSDAVNEVQRVTITGSPTGGTFTLTYAGQTTAPIAYNATATDVANALIALSNIGASEAVGSGGPLPGTAVDITFTGTLGGLNVAQMTADGSGLTGGSSPTVTISTVTAGKQSSGLTIATWVWLDAAGGDRTIAGKYSSLSTATNCEFALTFLNTTNRFRWSISDGVSILGNSANNFGNVPLATWCFVVGVFDQANNQGRISVNAGSSNNFTVTTCRDGTQAFRVGGDAGGTRLWDGRIDNLMLWRRPLTNGEIATLYNGGNGLTIPF